MKKKIAMAIGYGQSNRDGFRSLSRIRRPSFILRYLNWCMGLPRPFGVATWTVTMTFMCVTALAIPLVLVDAIRSRP